MSAKEKNRAIFDNQATELLIVLWEGKRVLYDKTHENYVNKEVKANALKFVAGELNQLLTGVVYTGEGWNISKYLIILCSELYTCSELAKVYGKTNDVGYLLKELDCSSDIDEPL